MDYRGYEEGESKVYFVKSRQLMTIISRLDGSEPLESILEGTEQSEDGVDMNQEAILQYLSNLVQKGVLLLV
jgi:hypothetical protein